jgi:hypothetical protein
MFRKRFSSPETVANSIKPGRLVRREVGTVCGSYLLTGSFLDYITSFDELVGLYHAPNHYAWRRPHNNSFSSEVHF